MHLLDDDPALVYLENALYLLVKQTLNLFHLVLAQGSHVQVHSPGLNSPRRVTHFMNKYL